jgi:hypothetical protein
VLQVCGHSADCGGWGWAPTRGAADTLQADSRNSKMSAVTPSHELKLVGVLSPVGPPLYLHGREGRQAALLFPPAAALKTAAECGVAPRSVWAQQPAANHLSAPPPPMGQCCSAPTADAVDIRAARHSVDAPPAGEARRHAPRPPTTPRPNTLRATLCAATRRGVRRPLGAPSRPRGASSTVPTAQRRPPEAPAARSHLAPAAAAPAPAPARWQQPQQLAPAAAAAAAQCPPGAACHSHVGSGRRQQPRCARWRACTGAAAAQQLQRGSSSLAPSADARAADFPVCSGRAAAQRVWPRRHHAPAAGLDRLD